MKAHPIRLMIVGAAKAGTSSLTRYLGQHPSICICICICTHKQLEMNYFVVDKNYLQGYKKNYIRYFGNCKTEDVVILGKSVGIMYLREAVKRLHAHNPDVHVIAVLRNPVERAYSAFWYEKRMGRENLTTFEEAIEADKTRLREDSLNWRHCVYLDRGIYHSQIEALFDFFQKEQVHVFLFDDLKKDPVNVCRAIFKSVALDDFVPDTGNRFNRAAIARSEKVARFLSLDNPAKRFVRYLIPDGIAYFLKKKIRNMNKKEFAPPPMNSETRALLIEFFKHHNEILGKMLGLDLSRWNE